MKNVKKKPSLKQKKLLKKPQRLKRLLDLLRKRKLNAYIISSAANRYYLTGWLADSESGFVLATPKKSFIITDSRYFEHAVKETEGFEIFQTEEGVGPALRALPEKEKSARIGFESHHLSVFSFKHLKKVLKKVKLVPEASLIEKLREVKDEIELGKIRKSVALADRAFTHILSFIKPGISEKEVAWELEDFLKKAGADGLAWNPIIVAAGANSSMAHWGAENTKIRKNDMVLLDFGCIYQGYCSDISRVIFVGKPNSRQIEIYNLVLEAQKLGIGLVKEGRTGATIDKKVRSFLEKNLPSGVDSKHIYKHALGHGVGLEIHELPSMNIRRKNKLATGSITTIEPGIYIPGWGGIRIEDMVLVTKEGCEIFTKAPKEIREITIT